MRKWTFIFLTILTSPSFAQFPEIDNRTLWGVAEMQVWRYDINKTTEKVTDSSLYTLSKYNKNGLILEYRSYTGIDSIQFRADLYDYDTLHNNRTTINHISTVTLNGCLFPYSRAKKKIEYANEKGQLIKVVQYNDDQKPWTITYEYDNDDRLILVKLFDGKDLEYLHKIKYKLYK